jgi:MtfA peptidase
MVQTLLFLLALSAIITWIWVSVALTQLRRKRLKKKPFPLHWVAVIEQDFPLYKRLPQDFKKQLHGHIHVFLTEKNFIGCGGLQMTDEIKLAIAAQACLLLLHEKGNYFAQLKDILVYPSAFIANSISPFGNSYLEGKEVKIGESWARGTIVLSWENIKYDALNWQDGHNVILHEFAHQLDQENGPANGVPTLGNRSAYTRWSRVFTQEYHELCRQVQQGKKTVIDEYGATNPAEFFAVATETFFEKPKQMQAMHPKLYAELKCYYKSDPIEWMYPPRNQREVKKSDRSL